VRCLKKNNSFFFFLRVFLIFKKKKFLVEKSPPPPPPGKFGSEKRLFGLPNVGGYAASCETVDLICCN